MEGGGWRVWRSSLFYSVSGVFPNMDDFDPNSLLGTVAKVKQGHCNWTPVLKTTFLCVM